MTETPIEKKFSVLSEITRAQHFAWREAVCESFPEANPTEVVRRMWTVTGEQTARGYLKRIDPERPIAPQVAQSIAWSSRCMGEEVVVEEDGEQVLVRHLDCPWFHWHRKLGLLAEDRPGCDAWFRAVVDGVNEELGTKVHFETVETLPDGAAHCLRRFWVEEGSVTLR